MNQEMEFKEIRINKYGRPILSIHAGGGISNEAIINYAIKEGGIDTNLISDGYHTFSELYEHRIVLYIKFAQLYKIGIGIHKQLGENVVWRTLVHSDGIVLEGWFILGMKEKAGEQITYHLPIDKWEECNFADTIEKAPEWDGHTSADVLERIKNL